MDVTFDQLVSASPEVRAKLLAQLRANADRQKFIVKKAKSSFASLLSPFGVKPLVHGSWTQGIPLPDSDCDISCPEDVNLSETRRALRSLQNTRFSVREVVSDWRLLVRHTDSRVLLDVTQKTAYKDEPYWKSNHISKSLDWAKDENVKSATLILKLWVRKHADLFQPKDGYPNSYTFLLIFLFLCTHRQNPVVPLITCAVEGTGRDARLRSLPVSRPSTAVSSEDPLVLFHHFLGFLAADLKGMHIAFHYTERQSIPQSLSEEDQVAARAWSVTEPFTRAVKCKPTVKWFEQIRPNIIRRAQADSVTVAESLRKYSPNAQTSMLSANAVPFSINPSPSPQHLSLSQQQQQPCEGLGASLQNEDCMPSNSASSGLSRGGEQQGLQGQTDASASSSSSSSLPVSGQKLSQRKAISPEERAPVSLLQGEMETADRTMGLSVAQFEMFHQNTSAIAHTQEAQQQSTEGLRTFPQAEKSHWHRHERDSASSEKGAQQRQQLHAGREEEIDVRAEKFEENGEGIPLEGREGKREGLSAAGTGEEVKEDADKQLLPERLLPKVIPVSSFCIGPGEGKKSRTIDKTMSKENHPPVSLPQQETETADWRMILSAVVETEGTEGKDAVTGPPRMPWVDLLLSDEEEEQKEKEEEKVRGGRKDSHEESADVTKENEILSSNVEGEAQEGPLLPIPSAPPSSSSSTQSSHSDTASAGASHRQENPGKPEEVWERIWEGIWNRAWGGNVSPSPPTQTTTSKGQTAGAMRRAPSPISQQPSETATQPDTGESERNEERDRGGVAAKSPQPTSSPDCPEEEGVRGPQHECPGGSPSWTVSLRSSESVAVSSEKGEEEGKAKRKVGGGAAGVQEGLHSGLRRLGLEKGFSRGLEKGIGQGTVDPILQDLFDKNVQISSDNQDENEHEGGVELSQSSPSVSSPSSSVLSLRSSDDAPLVERGGGTEGGDVGTALSVTLSEAEEHSQSREEIEGGESGRSAGGGRGYGGPQDPGKGAGDSEEDPVASPSRLSESLYRVRISGIPLEVTREEVAEALAGNILHPLSVSRLFFGSVRFGATNRGSCVVDFGTREEAEWALKVSVRLKGKIVRVRWEAGGGKEEEKERRPAARRESPTGSLPRTAPAHLFGGSHVNIIIEQYRVRVLHLPPVWRSEDLRGFLEEKGFCQIEDTFVLFEGGEKEKNRGVGFVVFRKADDAKRLMEMTANGELVAEGNCLVVDSAYVDRVPLSCTPREGSPPKEGGKERPKQNERREVPINEQKGGGGEGVEAEKEEDSSGSGGNAKKAAAENEERGAVEGSDSEKNRCSIRGNSGEGWLGGHDEGKEPSSTSINAMPPAPAASVPSSGSCEIAADPSNDTTEAVTLILSRLSYTTTADELRQEVEQMGFCPLNVSLPPSKEKEDECPGWQNRGYGFVSFKTRQEAESLLQKKVVVDGRKVRVQLIKEAAGKLIDGNKLRLQWARERDRETDGARREEKKDETSPAGHAIGVSSGNVQQPLSEDVHEEQEEGHGGGIETRRVLVGNLPRPWRHDDFHSFMNRSGFPLIDAAEVHFSQGKAMALFNSGFGFLTFLKSEDVGRLVGMANRGELVAEGRRLSVQRSCDSWGGQLGVLGESGEAENGESGWGGDRKPTCSSLSAPPQPLESTPQHAGESAKVEIPVEFGGVERETKGLTVGVVSVSSSVMEGKEGQEAEKVRGRQSLDIAPTEREHDRMLASDSRPLCTRRAVPLQGGSFAISTPNLPAMPLQRRRVASLRTEENSSLAFLWRQWERQRGQLLRDQARIRKQQQQKLEELMQLHREFVQTAQELRRLSCLKAAASVRPTSSGNKKEGVGSN
uniref:RRM domain-containing protein n=1 Tax=Chromera velia CCMP2878 TaxID=1169474 RepID=A0A0G4HP93_9ALVE|eukprot:Cvel_7730.t1-p1 / transcript=Cvel_7730.t1 / gene=Cvel_7730 / organism=Chromera_velia_CCMP2878 / gene_product=hypothetical protein / transcript_product=hypothetical protein / location=Cvel_scaffold411:17781-25126(+) / protein_length=1834 / sequence_SO=supercontig / SO=protein_coding / is_pseudo=false